MSIWTFTALLAAVAPLLMVPLTRTVLAAAPFLRSWWNSASAELPVAPAPTALEELLGLAFVADDVDAQAVRASATVAARARYDVRWRLA